MITFIEKQCESKNESKTTKSLSLLNKIKSNLPSYFLGLWFCHICQWLRGRAGQRKTPWNNC